MKHTADQILEKLKTKFPQTAFTWQTPENGDASLIVPADHLVPVVQFLKDSSELAFDFLMSVSAFDGLKWLEGDAAQMIEVTYHLHSYQHRHTFIVKVRAPRQNGQIPTLTGLYGCADFQEREVFDHFGVAFIGHPNLKRILLPDDWVGHPLLKDYEEQAEYNGMGTTRPSML